jgi:hypothetical protein
MKLGIWPLTTVLIAACSTAPRPPVPDVGPALARLEEQAAAAKRQLDASDRFLDAAERGAVLRPGPERKRAGRGVLVRYVEMREARREGGSGVCR